MFINIYYYYSNYLFFYVLIMKIYSLRNNTNMKEVDIISTIRPEYNITGRVFQFWIKWGTTFGCLTAIGKFLHIFLPSDYSQSLENRINLYSYLDHNCTLEEQNMRYECWYFTEVIYSSSLS